MNVVGISAFYHDSACCLLVDGRLVAAAQEERFSRVKHDARLPVAAFRFCLDAADLGVEEIDCVAYYESPVDKLARQLWAPPWEEEPRELAWLDAGRPRRLIRERLGYEGPIECFPHHASHAASAFFYSGFEQAAILTVDGVGEWTTTGYGRGSAAGVELFEEVRFPHSLGLLYSTLTAYLGFRVNDGEGKVMGLAGWGEPRYLDRLRRLVRRDGAGRYELDLDYFGFLGGRRMASPALAELLGRPARHPAEEIAPFHRDVAASLQALLEEVLLEEARYLAGRVPVPDLCLAGGVALNCVANGRLQREGPFARLFVQPAAGDAGGCLGAAALAWHRLSAGCRPAPLEHVLLGPSWPAAEVAALLGAAGLAAHDFRGREPELLAATVERLAAGRIVGWFQGAMELGPRALGARSLLASPLDPAVRERLNRRIKRREPFRPFAPSVLESAAPDYFELDRASPFMLEACAVRAGAALPAVTHVDGSARPQTVSPATQPRFAALLEAFGRHAGRPVLLNTSFNRAGEPIVCSPVDALATMAATGLDSLVIEDFVLDREALPANLGQLLAGWESERGRPPRPAEHSLSENLYTFV